MSALRQQSFGIPALAALLSAAAVGLPGAAHAQRPTDPPSVSTLRALVGHYRSVTWTFERAAHRPRQRTSFVDRRTTNRDYLRWTIDLWTRRAYAARSAALVSLHRRFAVSLPKPPPFRASLSARVRYSRRLTHALRKIYTGRTSRAAVVRGSGRGALLRRWQLRSALAALDVSRHAARRAQISAPLQNAFLCIHRYEAAWDANTGNGYYGGLQMDLSFQARYGSEFLARFGTADRWPVWAQLEAAARAYGEGQGFWPWPNTARVCGLL